MKVVMPMAGLGTRLRPHTYSKAKPLLPVAGKPVLAHLFDRLQGLEVEEYIFIVGHLGEQIEVQGRDLFTHSTKRGEDQRPSPLFAILYLS